MTSAACRSTALNVVPGGGDGPHQWLTSRAHPGKHRGVKCICGMLVIFIHHSTVGDEPSPGLPISGSNRAPSSGRFMFEALTSIPNASVSMGVRLHISRAGRKTSHACSVVAPEYTSAPNSLSQANNTGQHRQRLPICRSYGDFGIHLPEAAQPGTFIDPAKRTADHKELPRLQRDEHPFECPLTLGMRQQLNKFGGPFSRSLSKR